MTVGRIFTKKYISLYFYLALFFENRKNSGLIPGQNDDPVTRTWKMTEMTNRPGDPMTQFHVCYERRERPSVRLSVPSFDLSSGVQRFAAERHAGRRYRPAAAGAGRRGAQQQMRAVSC